MRRSILIPTLTALLLGPLVLAPAAHAGTAEDASAAIRKTLDEAERLRDAMGAATWRSIQGDLIRLRTLRSSIESVGGEIASEETRLREIAERVEWLRLEADAAIGRHNRARQALDREIADWNARAKALGAAIDWHNANPPNPYDHAAVARYNANKRDLERRQRRLNQERQRILAKEANTVLPLRLAASKKERLWREKRAEGMRLIDQLRKRYQVLDAHIAAARDIEAALGPRVSQGIEAERDARPAPSPRPTPRAPSTPRRKAAPAGGTFLPVVAPGALITESEYRAALDNHKRIAGRLAGMQAELAKVRARSRSTLEEQRALYDVKRRALRDLVDDLLSLVEVDKLMKGMRLVKGIKRGWLTPAQAERVRLALEAAKAAAELGMARSESSPQAAGDKLLGTLADGEAALERAHADLRSVADRRGLRQLALAHTAMKAAAKLAKHAADRHGEPTTDLAALGELTVELTSLVVPVVKLPQATAKIAVHWREKATADSILEDLSFARSMHGRAERALEARVASYRRQLFEAQMTIRKYETR